MIVRKLRLKKGWSQEHLAHISGLNVRTIQRIEQGSTASLETKKSLASVFEVDIASFNSINKEADKISDSKLTSGNQIMNSSNANVQVTQSANSEKNTVEEIQQDEKEAIQFAKNIKDFLTNILMFTIFIPIIFYKIGFESTVFWVASAWLATIIIQGLHVFEKINIFNVDWERKIAEWKLGRKL